ncbi:MAG: hypothetical protein M5R36_03710 [Deltaproteobacteria bacterium]|nr:hypothetical protein [Deltaproteobacteria bacterium]
MDKLVTPGVTAVMQARQEVERVVDRLVRRGNIPGRGPREYTLELLRVDDAESRRDQQKVRGEREKLRGPHPHRDAT